MKQKLEILRHKFGNKQQKTVSAKGLKDLITTAVVLAPRLSLRLKLLMTQLETLHLLLWSRRALLGTAKGPDLTQQHIHRGVVGRLPLLLLGRWPSRSLSSSLTKSSSRRLWAFSELLGLWYATRIGTQRSYRAFDEMLDRGERRASAQWSINGGVQGLQRRWPGSLAASWLLLLALLQLRPRTPPIKISSMLDMTQ